MDILEYLGKRQAEQGTSDKQFAAQLDCSRQLWQGTRSGTIPLGSTILKGAARAFPELRGEASHLLIDLPSKTKPEAPEKASIVETIKRFLTRHQR